jgi:hypothetical protein
MVKLSKAEVLASKVKVSKAEIRAYQFAAAVCNRKKDISRPNMFTNYEAALALHCSARRQKLLSSFLLNRLSSS